MGVGKGAREGKEAVRVYYLATGVEPCWELWEQGQSAQSCAP